MQKLTLKDFLTKNSPCFVCKSKMNFRCIYTTEKETFNKEIYIENGYVICNLYNSYYTSIDLYIQLSDHQFYISKRKLSFSKEEQIDIGQLINDRKIFLSLNCPQSCSLIYTSQISLDINTKLASSFAILRKDILFKKYNKYYINYVYEHNDELKIYMNDLSYSEYPNTLVHNINLPIEKFESYRSMEEVIKMIKLFLPYI